MSICYFLEYMSKKILSLPSLTIHNGVQTLLEKVGDIYTMVKCLCVCPHIEHLHGGLEGEHPEWTEHRRGCHRGRYLHHLSSFDLLCCNLNKYMK